MPPKNIFLTNKNKFAKNNKNKNILARIVTLTNIINQKEKIKAQYLKEYQKNMRQMNINSNIKSNVNSTIKNTIVDGVKTVLKYFIPQMYNQQKLIKAHIEKINKEIQESKQIIKEEAKNLDTIEPSNESVETLEIKDELVNVLANDLANDLEENVLNVYTSESVSNNSFDMANLLNSIKKN